MRPRSGNSRRFPQNRKNHFTAGDRRSGPLSSPLSPVVNVAVLKTFGAGRHLVSPYFKGGFRCRAVLVARGRAENGDHFVKERTGGVKSRKGPERGRFGKAVFVRSVQL